MNKIRKGIAVLLSMAMCIPGLSVPTGSVPVSAAVESQTQQASQAVRYNTGSYEYCVVDEEERQQLEERFLQEYGAAVTDTDAYADNMDAVAAAKDLSRYVCFDNQGRYEIQAEEDAFFPYEVQFTYDGKTESLWFMSPEDTVLAGGHEFYLNAPASGNAMTRMSLDIGGKTVDVYPEPKTFTDHPDGSSAPVSLLPLEEKRLTVDLRGYTPLELSKVAIDKVFTNQEVTAEDFIMWKYGYGGNYGEYKISTIKDAYFDLSVYTYMGYTTSWEMIVGEKDQLAAENTRYLVSVNCTQSREWLTPVICRDDGSREDAYLSDNDYYDPESTAGRYMQVNYSGAQQGDYFVSFHLNTELFKDKNGLNIKVFEGNYTENDLQNDITDRIWNVDMSNAGSGYRIPIGDEFVFGDARQWFTFVCYDAQGAVTGCLPVQIRFYRRSYTGISLSYLREKEDNYTTIVYRDENSQSEDQVREKTYYLYQEYPANGSYVQKMEYERNGVTSLSDLSAYVGKYDSADAAKNAGAQDVKDALFGNGYEADYSGGVLFSIFIGPQENQQKYYYRIRTVTSEHSKYESSLSSTTQVWFEGIKDADGTEVPAYVSKLSADSYGDHNYYMILAASQVNGKEVDLSKLALVFSKSDKVTLYAGEAGNGTAEESGVSLHDFSQGIVPFASVSEDGGHSQNYFIQIVKAVPNQPKLFINSLKDEASKTSEKDGVVYSTREAMLDNYHSNKHDILVANIGTVSMSALSVQLQSDFLDLDEYWTLNGRYDLSGFTATETDADYAELPNLAKIRLKAKENAEPGEYEFGTLTIKSGDQVQMVITLTGVIGNPCITTKEIPSPTKYVPFGMMIMNSNKYDWNKVTYELVSGKLPDGMELMESGELYGVPKEAGEFEITVKMKNSYGLFPDDTKSFTFTVLENTDENVDNAEDQGYKLTKRISGIYDREEGGAYLVISEGVFDEFVDLYIDGVKQTRGTDYDAESGSTRLVIAAQALPKSEGKHTIGVEFQQNKKRSQVKKGAQNYYVSKSSSDSSGSSGGSSSGSSGGWYGGSTGSTPSTGSTKPADTKPADPKPADTGNTGNTGNTGSTTPAGGSQPEKPAAGTGDTGNSDTTISKAMLYARNYTVQQGDTLKSLAKKYYGKSSKWKKIYDANKKKLSSASASAKLKKGTKLQIPAINYTVKKGDTVKDIAKKYFGARSKWKLIYQVNKDAITPSLKVKEGAKLVIPVPVVCMIYTVKKGETLQDIAEKFYGKSSKWEKIYNANKNKVTASKKVKAGKQLFIPAMNCTVNKGDDLKKLAKKYYGARSEWRRIYEANKDVVASDKKLKAGVSLVIPVPVDLG